MSLPTRNLAGRLSVSAKPSSASPFGSPSPLGFTDHVAHRDPLDCSLAVTVSSIAAQFCAQQARRVSCDAGDKFREIVGERLLVPPFVIHVEDLSRARPLHRCDEIVAALRSGSKRHARANMIRVVLLL